MSRSRIVSVLLALITLLVYLPVRHHEFLNFDDGKYVSENPIVQAGLTWAGVKWAFTTWHMANWHPLTWLSHMLDCQLFGSNAGGHHLVNVFFHAINAVLLFLLLLRMTHALWQSAFVAAVFAWHPLRVESVAWVAERKDLLSAFFGLLTLMAYVRYAGKSKVRNQTTDFEPLASRLRPPASGSYWLALGLFALGLMAKPMLVTLPFVLLLLDYWPLNRVPGFEFRVSSWRGLVLEKWPFFALAAASCVVTFIAQQSGGSVAPLERDPMGLRLENVVVSYAMYLFKTVCPVNLAVIYPLPEEIPWAQTLAATVILGLISWRVWRGRRDKPYLLTGWLWFLGMLVPVIGLVQVGFQSMADRYTYLPLIGVLIGVTFGVGDWVVKRRFKAAILILVAGIVLGGCLFATARQLRFWQDSETLFAHALAVTQGNHVAHNDLGMALLQKGQVDEAIAHFQKAVEIRADYVRALHNLGAALMQRGRVDEAIAPLQKALELEPKYAAAHYTFGTALLKKGRVEEAIAHYQAALEDQPQNVGIANNLAWVLATSPTAPLRNGAKAVELAEQADRLSDSKNPGVIGTLAAAYAEAGRFPEAIAAAERALHLAATQNDAARVDTLKTQIQCYKAGSPFRDNSQTNGLHENPLPQK